MIAFQFPTIPIILIVLSFLHIDASIHRYIRQVTANQCQYPDIVMCDYVQCTNGRCVEDKNSVDCYKCQCAPGFTGKLCDSSILTPSACNPTCQNGGECSQTATNTFICICPPEYTGNQCETSVLENHPCIKNPATVCQNGGTCNINGANYLCSCAIGWTGQNCQTLQTTSSCNSNPCGAHGTCIPNGSGIFCNCENRWTGQYCDVNLDNVCPVGHCLSGGTCQMNGSAPYCNCPPTHIGQRCEIFIGGLTTTTTASTGTPPSVSCATNPCLNGGSCYATGSSALCLCKQGWSGQFCNVQNVMTTPIITSTANPGTCSSNPCSNGGSCIRHGNSYICVCTLQYTGPTCALARTTTTPPVISPNSTITCLQQPCRNGATCYNSGSSYYCYCGSNSLYTGKNCETSIAPLPTTTTPSPTPNCPLNCGSGTCVNVGNGNQMLYACLCQGTLTPTACLK
ncbi:unnamed protein product [Rotaria magnacalcarata]|uniref:EGF-like domain-containing protein n=1 Tax=Rotaria magnacalcarata TaxID=392030 RepID=A0A816FHF1_9BILA|nr:unnamed protein product [Rotaria magnacalcarata]CAF1661576.1 unnamed protein product [Rotaria magnacalcarata]CAF1967401.1 unnamed protein product [Rotaria magnacalcarata]CAF2078390.1 unnamed protein product [Rotaria magnacalcarata]CAF2082314.1 unnamed protein product [Rotaria magnacalcarata]